MATKKAIKAYMVKNIDKFRRSDSPALNLDMMIMLSCSRFDDYDATDRIPAKYRETALEVQNEWLRQFESVKEESEPVKLSIGAKLLKNGLTGERVKQRRQALKFSQNQLADELGITQTWISQIETGKKPIEHTLAIAIEAVLGYYEAKGEKDDDSQK